MIWKPVPVYVMCLFLASATSAFSGDQNDFTDAQSVLKHFDITVVKTEKDLAPEASDSSLTPPPLRYRRSITI